MESKDLIEFLKEHKISIEVSRFDELFKEIIDTLDEIFGSLDKSIIIDEGFNGNPLKIINGDGNRVYALKISGGKKTITMFGAFTYDPDPLEYLAEVIRECRFGSMRHVLSRRVKKAIGRKAAKYLINNVDSNVYLRIHRDLLRLGFSPIRSKFTDTYVYERDFDAYHLNITVRLDDPEHSRFDYISMNLSDKNTGEVYFSEDKILYDDSYEEKLKYIKSFIEMYG